MTDRFQGLLCDQLISGRPGKSAKIMQFRQRKNSVMP